METIFPISLPENKWTRKEFMSALFREYNRLRAIARKDPQIIEEGRLNKALGIMQSKKYWEEMMQKYEPTELQCGCKDEEYHYRKHRRPNKGGTYAGPCKHRIAVQIFQAMEEKSCKSGKLALGSARSSN